MNELTVSVVRRMTSMEISELVEKRHDNVKRTIENLVEKGVITQPQIEDESYKDGSGRKVTTKVYLLDKRSSLIVVAQLSPEFTARVVDRWQELEAAQPDPAKILASPEALRGLLLSYTEKVIELEHKVNEQAPKVAALERISLSDGAHNITNTAKQLQVNPSKLFTWMATNTWIYRRPGGRNWVAYQPRIQQGLLAHKVATVTREDGTEKTVEQVLVTPKGLTKLASVFNTQLEQGGVKCAA